MSVMNSPALGKFTDWMGVTSVESAEASHAKQASMARRVALMAVWIAVSAALFVYLQTSATGEDGIGGYLPLVTSGLVFSTGSLLTLSTMNPK